MEEVVIKRLSEMDEAGVEQAADIFADSFYEALRMFSKDRAVLAKAMKHSFVRDRFFAALADGRVVGIFGYSTSEGRAHRFDKRQAQAALGAWKGWLFHTFVRGEMEKPLGLTGRQCYIESVATDRRARGKGIATKLQHHLIEALDCDEFILEVVDTNTNAIRLYEKLGFTVFRKKKQRFFRKQAGFNERWYMRKTVTR